MSIDAHISAVRRYANKTELSLEPRRSPDRQSGIPGRRKLMITKNPNYKPQVGDEIWGNAHQCMIGDHSFRRIMRLYDGTEEIL